MTQTRAFEEGGRDDEEDQAKRGTIRVSRLVSSRLSSRTACFESEDRRTAYTHISALPVSIRRSNVCAGVPTLTSPYTLQTRVEVSRRRLLARRQRDAHDVERLRAVRPSPSGQRQSKSSASTSLPHRGETDAQEVEQLDDAPLRPAALLLPPLEPRPALSALPEPAEPMLLLELHGAALCTLGKADHLGARGDVGAVGVERSTVPFLRAGKQPRELSARGQPGVSEDENVGESDEEDEAAHVGSRNGGLAWARARGAQTLSSVSTATSIVDLRERGRRELLSRRMEAVLPAENFPIEPLSLPSCSCRTSKVGPSLVRYSYSAGHRLPPAQLANHVDQLLVIVFLRRLDPHPPVHTHRHLEREPRAERAQDRVLGRK